jgi:hypothetical protein
VVGLPGGVSVDTVGRGPSASHSLVVLADLALATGSLAGGTVGVPYSDHLQASGGTVPYKWSASGLPAGLGLDAASGVVSGSPIQAGSFTVQVSVTDSDGIVASKTLAVSIAPAGIPALSALTVSPRRLSLAGRLVRGRCKQLTRATRHNRPCRMKLVLRVSFDLSATGSVTFSFKRVTKGRLVKARCVKATRANRKAPRCTLLTPVGVSITRSARAGANVLKLARSSLRPGSYRLIATPSSRGHTGSPQQVTITITR